MTEATKSGMETAVATVLYNGTITSIEAYVNGTAFSYPSLPAEGTFLLLLLPYEADYTANYYTAPAVVSSIDFGVTGPVSETFGPTAIPVYTYSANDLPLQMGSCGFTETLTAFSLQAGTIPGTSLTVATSVSIAGESQIFSLGTTVGTSLTANVVASISLLSVTKA